MDNVAYLIGEKVYFCFAHLILSVLLIISHEFIEQNCTKTE